MVKIVLYFLSLTFSLSAFSLESVTAAIDKNPAVKGESIVLEVIADDDVATNALDTSVLLKDFIVGRTSTSSQTQIVNGSASRQTKWTTVLVPRKSGKVIIPALKVKNKHTAPIALVVLEQSAQKDKQRDIYIESAIAKQEIYVQQQVTLTVKLYVGVPLEGGSLSDPSMADANISKLGEDTQKEEIINGRRFQVIERKFAISPQKSGEFSLEMPIFSGQISMPSQRRSGLFGFNQSKPVTVISDALQLIVKPQPNDYQGDWLPSELFTLHEEWQPKPNEFMVGDPITRTVTVTAVGITEEQLPKLEMPAAPGLKIYPDQPAVHSGINSNRLVSQAVINFAIVASYAGEFELPEIKIPWFNTVTNQTEFATLPARKITVKPNPEMMINAQTPNPPAQITPERQPSTLLANNSETVYVEKASWLQWLFLALWLVTSFMWATHSYLRNRKAKPAVAINPINQPYLALLSGCKKNQGREVLTALVPWFKSLLPTSKITNLSQGLNNLNNSELTAAVADLQASYYGKNTGDWQGQKLLKVIVELNKQHINQEQKLNFALNP
ncbi:MAG: BatD family protein [Thalassotalea sp.]